MQDVNAWSININAFEHIFYEDFFQILLWKTLCKHKYVHEFIFNVEYFVHGGFGILGLNVLGDV
jgi:hypothetical protein